MGINISTQFKLYFCIIAISFIIIGFWFPSYKVKAYRGITPEEVYDMIKAGTPNVYIIDVRTPEEYSFGHIPQSINIPIQIFEETMKNKKIDKNAKLIIYCKSGIRSKKAAQILEELEYTDINNLGGINEWSYEIEKGY